MPKRTLEEIHEFNRKVEKKLEKPLLKIVLLLTVKIS